MYTRLRRTVPILVPALAAGLAAQTINLAPTGVASQSSYAAVGYPLFASWANDGNRDGYWWNYSTTCTLNSAGSWWQVALPAAATMHEVVLYNRADCCHQRLANFRLEAKLAGATVFAQDFYTSGGSVGSGYHLRVPLADGITADTVRITGLGYNPEGNQYLQIAEVEILQHGALRETNLGPMSPSAQSSTDGMLDSLYAVDGNTNGYVPAGSIARTLNAPGSWYRVDIDPGTVDRIRLWPATSAGNLGCGNFRVAVFSGGAEVWGQNWYPTQTMPITGPTVVTPPPGTNGDAVRITTLGPVGGQERIEFAEVEVIRLGNTVADQQVYGAGCPGSLGTPTLSTRDRPVLGSSFLTRIGNVPSSPGIAMQVIGLSHTSWNGIPLPLPLQAVGMNGCWSLASFDLGVVGLAGMPFLHDVIFQSTLPNTPSAAGLRLFLQGLVFDAAAPNAFGATVSNGMRLHLGT